MTPTTEMSLFRRKPLDEITQVPDDLISVYVVENHIWANNGSAEAKAARRAEPRTVSEFLIDPVRPFLVDILRLMAAPYHPGPTDRPIGQGYWIQAEFGSGKSHLLSFLGALALGGADVWELVREKEERAGLGRRESLYNLYVDGLRQKTEESKGILVVVTTLVGQGGGTIGMGGSDRSLTECVLDAIADQFFAETGKTLPLYPADLLIERFLQSDLDRYQRDLDKYLHDPRFFDTEEQEEAATFVDRLNNPMNPRERHDCGERLWNFYNSYLEIRPRIPMEVEDVLKHAIQSVCDAGYAGVLILLDEVSLFMKDRTEAQRVDDEKTLVVLSNRLAKVHNLPVWTVCAAQQAIESRMTGVKNIIDRDRLDLVLLLGKADDYYNIALSRVRTITRPEAIDQYYEDYKRAFSWPQSVGRDEFARFFPFYPPSIDVVRELSTRLTTVRSALHFMLETLKRQRALHGRELITLWSVFDDVVNYEEDPSGTTRAVASLRTKWPDAWRAYEQARHQIDAAPRGHLKVFGTRCDKIVRTLFLYHMAQLRPDGLTAEELMNHVMEWKDHERGQQADQQDNLDHYKVLIDRVEVELVQIKKEGDRFRFQVDQGGVLPHELYRKARADVEGDERERKQAWEALLSLDGWQAQTGLMRLDLGHGVRSIFREIAPESQTNITVNWHGRLIEGRVLMRNLLHLGQHGGSLLDINSAETGQDFYVYISSTPAGDAVDNLIRAGRDPRLLFWTPDDLTAKEQNLLADFAAYRALVRDYAGKETQDAQTVLSWVQDQLRGQMGVIYSIVTDSYSRGRLAALDHQKIPVNCQGELAAILTPPVSQVLDSVYISRELEFTAPAPLDDTNVINVINGIVKVGQIERGARPNRDISAARNYGVALQIMRAGNEHKLDISQCRYTRDMLEWIESKLLDPTESMAVESLYKNFQGIHGPNDIHYGLSKRLVQLYLLCLVRDGKLRVHMTGRNTPVEYIDYTNLAEIEFRTNVLDAMARLQRIRPPEGWNLLAPYAAALLNDPALRSVEQDADIQNAVGTVLAYRQEQKQPFQRFRDRFQELFDELDLPNPLADRLQQWETFLTARVDVSEAVSDLLRALDRAFGYAVWAEQRTEQEEVDDLAVRRAEVAKAQGFFEQRDRLLDAARYARHDLPDWPELDTARRALARTRDQLGNLAYYIDNATPFLTDLLEPAEEAIRSYTTRYLQAYGTVVARIEEARQYIERLPQSAPFRALERLADVRPLGQDPRPALRNTCRAALEGLPSTRATRETLSQELRHWPQPPSCAFTLGDHQTWVEQAEAAVQRCDAALREALLNKAALLHSEALRARLQQGAEEPFLADLLAARTPQQVADRLIATLGGEAADAAGAVALLQRYLLEIKVVRVRLADFRPSRQTIEREDLDAVTAEFRAFLQQALRGATDDDQQLPIIELE